MSGKAMSIDLSEYEKFFREVADAGNGKLKKEIMEWIDGIATEFLDVLVEDVIKTDAVATRDLIHSFERGAPGNIWTSKEGTLSIEVGTSVKYASYVNDGHWTNKKGVERRWVPGYWTAPPGDPTARFVYDPSAKTGMLLKQQWIKGKHYWDKALRDMERILPKFTEKAVEKWVKEYFAI
jgi:hypothetical protein